MNLQRSYRNYRLQTFEVNSIIVDNRASSESDGFFFSSPFFRRFSFRFAGSRV